MAELQKIPAEEYETKKKMYGFTDEQMKSILKLEPIKTRWADGLDVNSKTETKDDSIKSRHQQLVEEIKNKLKQEQSSENTSTQQNSNTEPSAPTEEKVEPVKTAENSTPVFDIPVFDMPQEEVQPTPEIKTENESFNVPTFEMPEFDNVAINEEAAKTEVENIPTFEMPTMEMQPTPTSEPVIETTPTFEQTVEPQPTMEKAEEIQPVEEENFNVPSFEMPEFDNIAINEETSEIEEQEEATAFEIKDTPTFENKSSEPEPVFASSRTQSRDEMFEMGQKRLLDLLKSDNEVIQQSDFTR